MSSFKHNIGLLKALLVRIPLILKTLFLHEVHMSPVSGKQDLRTELTVAIIRSFMTFSHSITKMQQNSMRDPGIKGPMWVSKVVLPQPEFDVRDAVLRAIEDLKMGDETFDIPAIGSVEAEWTGYRSGVGKSTAQPDLSEAEKYRELKKESSSDTTILFFHGGAYFLMDPCTHRVPVAHLSRLTGSPVLSVRYRLAPQNPFPAALVDALTAYLSLIHPPPGALHDPVPARKIVIAGDSAGGNLSLVLLQTLLTLQRASRSINFHGKEVPIELPAGVATVSPWCDISRAMPSIIHNAKFDYLDLPAHTREDVVESKPFTPIPFPADAAWPVSPPRSDMYVNAKTVLHPLVSPLAASPELWKGAPPIFISTGEESLTDEGLITARRLHEAGVPVVAEQFEGMPHCHGFIMMSTPASKRFFKTMSEFCRNAGTGSVTPTGNLTYLGFKLRSTREISLEKISNVSDEEVEERLQRSAKWRLDGEIEMLKSSREWARL
ncbi:hypothetical protein N7532_004198 [Penicillium argentinense]|uniref:Alpha/beta hydrolase fold-3 domain-containing protein n=1 Tax=Penicillium argentinense TaxID=1131581 RepID=A0A9W9FP15_9EURO|nr:uncharacterized protein N7532_004198 [Penicillium argentinense]KAJ5103669.1 hypothetical protein N7532_004198 [Penicillium argentinense]